MRNLIKIYSVAFLCLCSFAASAIELSEESVKAFIAKTDKATAELNIAEISKALSNDVIIIITASTNGQEEIITTNKQEYISVIEKALFTTTNYKYEKISTDIKIKQSKAYVKAITKESMTIQGRDISSETKSELRVELIDGELLITKMVAY